MQNKPNLRNDKMNINLDMTINYKILSALRGQKTKPIQSQFNPKQSQFNPKQTQPKPIKAKRDAFAWIRNLTIVLIMLLADFTTLKGANLLRLQSKENSDI